jgi:hypothetical protein
MSEGKPFCVGDEIVVISTQYGREKYIRRKVAKVHKQYFVDSAGDKWNLNGWRRAASQRDVSRVEHWAEKYEAVLAKQKEIELRHKLEEQINGHLVARPVHSSVLQQVLDILNAAKEPAP